jgi:hypothetical protein
LVLNLTVEVMQRAPPHATEGDTSKSAFLHHDHPVPLSQEIPAGGPQVTAAELQAHNLAR